MLECDNAPALRTPLAGLVGIVSSFSKRRQFVRLVRVLLAKGSKTNIE